MWDVTGVVNQGEISIPLNFTPQGNPSNGWNLVGNPYPSAIDWDIEGAEGWTKYHISNVISVRDNGDGGGTFHYWDGDLSYDEIPDGQIASCQSIWVRATDEDPVLTIREGVKTVEGATFFRRDATSIPSFSLELRQGARSDRLYLR